MTRIVAPPRGAAQGEWKGRPRPTFSVVIAAYEAAAFVGDAVDSALTQTYPPLEVIVSDDGSTDDVAGALARFGGNVALLKNDHRGPGAARNSGFRAARGDFVAILDADDVYLPERLELLADAAAERPDLDVLTTDAYMELDGHVVRRVYDDGWTFAVDDQRTEIIRRNFVFGLAAVRRDRLAAVGGMDESPEIVEDWDLWIRLILTGSRVGLVDEPLARNRLRPTSLSSQREERLRARVVTLEKTSRDPNLSARERRVLRDATARQRAELAYLLARRSVAEGREDARRRALTALVAPVAGPHSVRPRSRLHAAAWAAAPRLARPRLRRTRADGWEGAGGLFHARDRMLHVAFYTGSATFGGAEQSLATLVAQLEGRVRPLVIGTSEAVVRRVAAGAPSAEAVILPHVHRKRDVSAIRAHLRLFADVRPDVLHLNLADPWESHWALAAAAAARVPVVEVVHLPRPPLRARQRAVRRLLARRIARRVTVGERSAGELARLAAVDPASVVVIPNGVADVELEPLPRPTAGLVVGTIGRLEPQKGVDVLLHALADVPGATLVVVGDGSARPELERLAARLGIADRVSFVGWTNEARRHLTAFDVFALASRFEAAPLVVVEAMLASLPVVATDVGSVSELVAEGETGLLVAPGDAAALAAALRSVLGDRERARELGRRGRERALREFAASTMARRYETVYDEVAR